TSIAVSLGLSVKTEYGWEKLSPHLFRNVTKLAICFSYNANNCQFFEFICANFLQIDRLSVLLPIFEHVSNLCFISQNNVLNFSCQFSEYHFYADQPPLQAPAPHKICLNFRENIL